MSATQLFQGNGKYYRCIGKLTVVYNNENVSFLYTVIAQYLF